MQAFDLIVLGGGSGGLAARNAPPSTARAPRCSSPGVSAAPASTSAACRKKSCGMRRIRPRPSRCGGLRIRRARARPRLGQAQARPGRLRAASERHLRAQPRAQGRSRRALARPAHAARTRSSARRRGVCAPSTCVIATGGHPRVPSIKGAALGITSDGFFELERAAARRSRRQRLHCGGARRACCRRSAARPPCSCATTRCSGTSIALLSDRAHGADARGRHRDRDRRDRRALTGKPGDLTLRTADGRSFDGFDTVIWAIGRAPNTRGARARARRCGARAERRHASSTSTRTPTPSASTRSATSRAAPSSRRSRSRPGGGSRIACSAVRPIGICATTCCRRSCSRIRRSARSACRSRGARALRGSADQDLSDRVRADVLRAGT